MHEARAGCYFLNIQIHPHSGILLSDKKEELSSHIKIWTNLKCVITKLKKPVLKGYILYDSNHMTFWKGQNYKDSYKISGFQGFGESDEYV